MIEHHSVVNLLFSIRSHVGFEKGSSMLSVTTFSFDICYLEFFMPLIFGGKLVVVSRSVTTDGFALAREIANSTPTHMQGTPSTWQLLLHAGWQNESKVKLLVGGEAVKEGLKDALTQMGDVWNVYGPTETTIWSTSRKLEAGRKVPIGKPLANTDFYILD
jgi:non-ribosomal peptide synthetase component F